MPQALQPIVLNGSHGEGGGALLRTALSLGALTQQPVRIYNVRGAMRKPGVQPEDLLFLQILAKSTNARVEGDDLDADTLYFEPRRSIKKVDMEVDAREIKAGAVPASSLVVAQALLPILAKGGALSQVELVGETHNSNTLSYDAFERSTLAAHRQQGLYAFPSLIQSGFGYGGAGRVRIEVEPSALTAIDWRTRGKLLSQGVVVTSTDIAPRIVQEAVAACGKTVEDFSMDAPVEHLDVNGHEPGLSVTFFASYENGAGSGSACLQRGKPVKEVVETAASRFMAWQTGEWTTDAFLADQLLLSAALAEGKSTYSTPNVTRRLTTMAWVIKQFLPIHVTIKGREGQAGTVTVAR